MEQQCKKDDSPDLLTPARFLTIHAAASQPFTGQVKLSRLIEGLTEILERHGEQEFTVTLPTGMALIILD